jgi:hypothetical protein
MAGDVDLIVECIGQNGPAAASGVDISEYNMAIKLKGLTRSLLNLSPGSTPDVAVTRDSVLRKIAGELGGNFSRLGAICLIGDSNGAGTILTIAKALKANRAPKPVYVAVGDLTMFPFKRDPPIPGLGEMVPKNAPKVTWGQVFVPVRGGLAPNAAVGDYPRFDNPGIEGDLLENYFTEQGNRISLFNHTPISPSGGWWWTSSMKGSEVHGAIEGGGWQNIPLMTISDGNPLLTGSGSIDDVHHGKLCFAAMTQMQAIAAQRLRGYVFGL